jgi:hypothetical protein
LLVSKSTETGVTRAGAGGGILVGDHEEEDDDGEEKKDARQSVPINWRK